MEVKIGVLIFVTLGLALKADVVELDPVYAVGPPILEQSEIRAEGKVDIVSEDILETLNAGDLTAALRRVPGVTVSRYNPVGAFGGSDGGGVFIRGHGSGRPGADISTSIDGIPLFVGVWTHPLIDTLSLDLAQSIEVVKGPQPVLLGNMGFGAVNLVPKRAEQLSHHGMLGGSYGHFETATARGQYSYADENSGVLLSASHRQSNGHRANADGEVDALYGHAYHRFSAGWTASLLFSATDSWANDPEPIGFSIPVTEQYQTRNRFYLFKLDGGSPDETEWSLKVHYEDGEGDWDQWHQPPPPPFPAQRLRSLTEYDNRGLKFKLNRPLGESLRWAVGMDWDRFGGKVLEDYEKGPTNRFDRENFEIRSPHTSIQGRIAEIPGGYDLKWLAGVRYMDHSVFDGAWSGQVNLLLQGTTADFYIQYAESANFPGVFVSVFGRRPPPWNVGEDWQTLESERIRHWEVGSKVHLSSALHLSVSAFHDEVSDSIRLIAPPPSGYLTNLGDYRTQGLEAMLHYSGKLFSGFGGITWLDADRELPNLPEWSGTIGLQSSWKKWRLSVDYQWVSDQLALNPRFGTQPQEIESYRLLNARIAYRVKQGERGYWECFLHGENLANGSYAYRPGYPMPGVNLAFGLKRVW